MSNFYIEMVVSRRFTSMNEISNFYQVDVLNFRIPYKKKNYTDSTNRRSTLCLVGNNNNLKIAQNRLTQKFYDEDDCGFNRLPKKIGIANGNEYNEYCKHTARLI